MTHRQVLIRADAGEGGGLGSLSRMVALAQELGRRGAQVNWITQGATAFVKTQGAGRSWTILAPAEPRGGTSDAEQLANMGRSLKALVVLDGPHFSAGYQDRVQRSAPLLVVDDEARGGKYRADLLLNQNEGSTALSYSGQLPPGAKTLIGAPYVLLRDEVLSSRPRLVEAGAAPQVLVHFGASCQKKAWIVTLNALIALSSTLPFECTCVAADALLPSLRSLAPSFSWVSPGPDFIRRLAHSDLYVGTFGGALWEVCYLGVPRALLAVSPNQRAMARDLGKKGVYSPLGVIDRLEPGELEAKLQAAVEHLPVRRVQVEAGRSLIDGKGRSRVVSAVEDLMMARGLWGATA